MSAFVGIGVSLLGLPTPCVGTEAQLGPHRGRTSFRFVHFSSAQTSDMLATMSDAYERAMAEIWSNANEEQRAYLADSGERAELKVANRLRWVVQLAEVTKQVASGSSSWQSIALFWLRLHGVRHDVIPSHQFAAELAAKLAVVPPVVKLGAGAFAAALAICDAMTLEEELAVDYLRHEASHLFVNGFHVDWKKREQKALTEMQLHRTKTSADRRDVAAAREALLLEYGGPEAFAQTLAIRLLPFIEVLFEVETELSNLSA